MGIDYLLANQYYSFIDQLYPYRDVEEDPDTLEAMLYNLNEIVNDIDEDDTETKQACYDIISNFTSAGIVAE